ncbi:MAG: SMP-30/gluconolactonase/LRE family protein [Ilumatobacteraceae bacterium]|nr:SMP-30/gluconolactonase/LRE family protein [Ilumatobacteraceae bacterium]
MTPDIVVDTASLLGEGPTWDARRGRLLWLDVDGQIFHQLDAAGSHTEIPLDRRVSAVVPAIDDGLIAVAGIDVVRIDESGRVGETIAPLPPDGDGLANDARCDPMGRLWVGTVDRSGDQRGGLFCVADDGSTVQVRDGIALSNGIDWSPDGRTCHYVDSLAHRVETIHLDADGLPTHSEPLAHIDAIPDGLSVDAEGAVWVALWDGGAIHRYTPDGRLDRVVEVPGGFITSCAFGGPDLTTLFITSARGGLPDEQLREQPHAGALFALDVGIAGRGYTPFGRHDQGAASTT